MVIVTIVRKPSALSVSENIELHNTGAINIEKCRIPNGRFPSNVLVSHKPMCKYVGTKQTKGRIGGYKYTDKTYQVEGFVAQCKPKSPSNYGGEIISLWECESGCAIFSLNQQSGQSVSKYFKVIKE